MSEATPTADTRLNYRRYREGDSGHGPWTEHIFQASHSHKCPT